VGRPRKIKIDAVQFIAFRDGESKRFTSRREALAYLAGAKRIARIEEAYYVCRGWELALDRYPEDEDDPLDDESFSGVRLTERQFVMKGSDRDALLEQAEARRFGSFAGRHTYLKNELLPALGAESRRYAKHVLDRIVASEEAGIQRFDERKAKQAEQAEAVAREAAIPTIGQLFERALSRKIEQGVIQKNTVDSYRYQAAALKTPVAGSPGTSLWDAQVHKVTEAAIQAWFEEYATTKTRFGKLPASKTLINALQVLADVTKALKRDPEHRQFADRLQVVETLLEEVHGATRDSDGWRNRSRLTNEQVLTVLDRCESDEERASMALLLAGCRPPSEPVALRWEHLEYDAKGNLWWHVSASAIEHVGGEIEVRNHTKTRDVDFRQLSICKSMAPWLEKLRGRSIYVLGSGATPMRPTDFVEMIEGLLVRADVTKPGISGYSFRHTVSDEVERLLGRTARDLVLHGKRDTTTGGLHYSHAERNRRRAELTIDGKPYGEHMVWAASPADRAVH
jgi:integrase